MEINDYYDGWIADNICPLCDDSNDNENCTECEVAIAIEDKFENKNGELD